MQTKNKIQPDSIPNMTPVITTYSPSFQNNWVFMQPIQITGQFFSDQTGRFPITSSQGKYISWKCTIFTQMKSLPSQ